MSLCHSITVEEVIDETEGPRRDKILYHSTSPDEIAFVNFAKFSGYEYMDTDNDGNIKIRIKNTNAYNIFKEV